MQKALVVGIDTYPGKLLSVCGNDARAVAELFAKHGNGDPNFDVELITAPQPHPETISKVSPCNVRSALSVKISGEICSAFQSKLEAFWRRLSGKPKS